MNIQEIMEEVATAIRAVPTLTDRTFAYPVSDISPPGAVVGYPENVVYDGGYGRGMDRITGVVTIVAGMIVDRATVPLIAGYMNGSGPESVKTAIEDHAYVSLDSIRVTNGEFDIVPIGGNDYIAVVLELDIVGPGAV